MNADEMNFCRQALLAALASLTLALLAPVATAAEPKAPVTTSDLEALAEAVNLSAWTQAAGSCGDFRTIAESWAAIYSPKDAIGMTGTWNAPVAEARALAARPTNSTQQRWLKLFIRAGEALGRQDAPEFIAIVRKLEKQPFSPAPALAATKIFTAK